MKEIETKEHIELLVEEFYKKVKQDELIGYIFNNVENFNWDTHIPIMVSFWETILLDAGTYRGNPMLTHIQLNRKSPLLPEHFTRWKQLLFETLDENFTGVKVTEAKQRVESMAMLMQFKIDQSSKPGFIQ
jgi:hemoglobin